MLFEVPTKHDSFGVVFEVPMSKICAPLWRDAHFQVKMRKSPLFWRAFGAFDVEKVGQKR